MVSRSVLRARARISLGGIFKTNWLMMVVAMLIVGAIMGVGSTMTYGIVTLILAGPLMVGLAAYAIDVARCQGKSGDMGKLFSGLTKRLGSNIASYLLILLRVFLWMLLFIIPGIVKAYSYAMVPFIRAEHPELSAKESLERSARMMKGHKMEYFLLGFSFLGWMLVGYVCCGIGTLWAAAYMQTTCAHFYLELKSAQTGEYYADGSYGAANPYAGGSYTPPARGYAMDDEFQAPADESYAPREDRYEETREDRYEAPPSGKFESTDSATGGTDPRLSGGDDKFDDM